MPSVNVSELISRARVAADMEFTNFVSPAGWLYFANTEYKNLYTRIARLGWPLATSTTEVTFAGDDVYGLTSCSAIISVKYKASASARLRRIPIKSEINQVHYSTGETSKTGIPTQVVITRATDGASLYFYPRPTTGSAIVTYVPYPETLVLSSPGFDETTSISMPLGWEERIVLGMARRALSKEETTNSSLEREIAEMDSIIENTVYSFLLAEANTVVDMNDDSVVGYLNWFWV